MTQTQVQKTRVRRIDECAREYEQQQNDEQIRKARRAVRRARAVRQEAEGFLADGRCNHTSF